VEFENVEMFAEWWIKCGMRNLDCNWRSENLLDAFCAIDVLKTAIYKTLLNRIFAVNLFNFNVYGMRCLK